MGEEFPGGIGADDIESHVLIRCQDIFELVLAEQAVVDENAGQVVADGLVEEHAGDGRIDAAAQAEDDLVVSDLRAQLGDGRFDEGIRGQVTLAAADPEDEVAQHPGAFGRVEHFRMELDGVGLFAGDLEGGVGDVGGRGDDLRSFREAGNRVAVGHPDLGMQGNVLHQRGIRSDDVEHGPAVFAGDGAFHIAAEMIGEVLGAVADAQQRKTALDGGQVHLRGVGVADRARTAGENDAFYGFIEDGDFVIGIDFTEDVEFSQPAADQLGHLGPSVENDDPFCHVNRFENTKIR